MAERRITKAELSIGLFISSAIGGIGQLLFKIGLSSTTILNLLIFIIAGVLAYGISTIIYLYALSRSHLSWVYGFAGISYIIAGLLAFFILREQVSPTRWFGLFVILIGTTLIGMS